MAETLWIILITAAGLSQGEQTTVEDEGASVISYVNYGYVLRQTREIQLATYEAKLMYHLRLPEWQITFDNQNFNCSHDGNITMACVRIQPILSAVREVRSQAQRYLQHQVRRVHEVVFDLPLNVRRGRRGFLTDVLSKVTGLASQDQLQAVRDILEQIETGIYRATQMWGDGSKNLVAAFQLQQRRMNNVFSILGMYRKTMRRLEVELIKTKYDRSGNTLFKKVFTLLSDTIFQVAEVDSLYTAVQFLMTGRIPHFILPHDVLMDSLEQVQNHLESTEPHMSLCRQDHAYYYLEAPFKTFRAGNTLVIIIDAPVTTDSLIHPFLLYEVTRLPLITPETETYYSLLSTDIKMVGFNMDSDIILQVLGSQSIPSKEVWLLNKVAITLLDRNKPTCASAIVAGRLPDIKALCRYDILKAPFPRGIVRLFSNSFLLTNISTLRMHCLGTDLKDGGELKTYHQSVMQTVHTFDCHCDQIWADEFRITADLRKCNWSENITSFYELHFPINVAYLSEYFHESQLFNISADTLLNYSVEIRLPGLNLAEKILDQKFGIEAKARFDMESIINHTKDDTTVFENLAHYIFNSLISAHSRQGDFDFLSVFTWLSIFGWITSGVALTLVIFLRFKVRSLTLLLMARATRAHEIPKLLTLPTTTAVSQTTRDSLQEWIRHVNILPNLLPVEVLILVVLIFLLVFFLAKAVYNKRRRDSVKTALVLEVGNAMQYITFPVMSLPHPPSCYRFFVNKLEVNLSLRELTFSAELLWNKGIILTNTVLEYQIVLPEKIRVGYYNMKLLQTLLQKDFYATLQVISGQSGDICELVVLQAFPSVEQPKMLYPAV